jgi:hypothetical protein
VADAFTVDTSEIDRLVADLRDYPDVAAKEVDQALEVNARNIKDSWKGKIEGNEHAPLAPLSIDYERTAVATFAGSGVEYEIGARKGIGKQGGVVLLLEYGAPKKRLGARGFGLASLSENVADLESGMGKALDVAGRKTNL